MAQDRWYQSDRLGGLRRFAVALTAFNLAGHTVLGFEQSYAQPLAALATAYSLELVIEWMNAIGQRRPPRFLGSFSALVHFLLSAHITALAVAMLLYANDRIWPIVFATAVAIGSKYLFRIAANGGSRHYLNPSNLGISVTLLAFPWVGIAPPYMFTENLTGAADWTLPAPIACTGSFLNWRFTRRWPLIASWLLGFAAHAVFRHLVFGTALASSFLPMTGVAFVLFTFYMVTDPATTPSGTRAQMLFGASVAVAYGVLMAYHAVFGLFFGLSLVCVGRGVVLALRHWARSREAVGVPAPALERGKP